MKVKLIESVLGYEHLKGRVGEVVENDYPEKYDVKIDFGTFEMTHGFLAGVTCRAVYYFHSHEVELLS